MISSQNFSSAPPFGWGGVSFFPGVTQQLRLRRTRFGFACRFPWPRFLTRFWFLLELDLAVGCPRAGAPAAGAPGPSASTSLPPAAPHHCIQRAAPGLPAALRLGRGPAGGRAGEPGGAGHWIAHPPPSSPGSEAAGREGCRE